ncbi:MAG TPA: hypothetical protein VI217_20980 [Mycobacterium sp.]|jgi:hypothetical protein
MADDAAATAELTRIPRSQVDPATGTYTGPDGQQYAQANLGGGGVGGDGPTETASIVEADLDRIDGRWLISGFEPR